ncbi:MAG: hypothetical protein JW768_05430 [Chitinispirillaceae bacterium]|nr:hypothetical protein [Chitinispirillaceae bacterium]
MNFFLLFLFALLVAVAAVSVVRIARLSLSWRARGLLMALRCAALVLIVIAFVEPSLTFERLPPASGSVPVLIDASKSMRLFSPESSVLPMLASFEQWNRRSPERENRFVLYCFGDSLRPAKPDERMQWSDRRSFFPEAFSDKRLRHATSLVLVTDGNWSNSRSTLAHVADKNCYYRVLGPFREYPYLHIDLEDFPSESVVDSVLSAKAVVEGFSAAGDTITVSACTRQRNVGMKRIAVGAGYFKRTVGFEFAKRKPGRLLYRFDASFPHDSLCSSAYAVHFTLSSRYTYACYGAKPSLDQRFIRLALKRQRHFTERGQGDTKPLDLLVLFDWDETAADMSSALAPWGTVLCVGCLPCSQKTVRLQEPVRFHRPFISAMRNPFDDLDFSRLPPPERMMLCAGSGFTKTGVMVSVLPVRSATKRPDTFDLVVIGRMNDRACISCAAKETWRFDFLPLAVAPDEERAFSFSDRLLSLAQEAIIADLSRTLLVYPASRLSSLDSLRLRVVFPGGSDRSADFTVRCIFTGDAQESGYDTSFVLTSTGSAYEIANLRPLSAGKYHLKVTARSGAARLSYQDSVRVEQDRSEYMVKGQNLSLLRELAQPLSDTGMEALRERFFNPAVSSRTSVKEIMHLSRSWPLLILLFLLLGAEWIIRRRLRLD